ncbi:MAG: TadE/TadG family type IV pilus assembly protein [Microthrixaceae bacterium]
MMATATAIPAMLALAALSVDLGSLFLQAARIQRAADAASLAGVVWLPDLPTAIDEAKSTAADNGYIDGVNATVNVTKSGPANLTVSIKAAGHSYFSRSFSDSIYLSRGSEAEYNLPVPMGSPGSSLGMGDYAFADGRPAQNNWLSIVHPCLGQEHGDLLSALEIASGRVCPTDPGHPPDAIPNPYHHPDGYTFAVQVHPGAGEIEVLAYDLGECDLFGGPQLRFDLYGADTTPFDLTDNPWVAGYEATDLSECGTLRPIFTIPAGAGVGRWILRVKAHPSLGGTIDANKFGLWARRLGDVNPCSAISDPVCPNLFAMGRLPVYVEATGASATMDLAEIGPAYAGETLSLQLFDPAEGARGIQVLDPNGLAMKFTYQSADGDYGPSTAESCPEGPCLWTDAEGPPLHLGFSADPYTGGHWKYNGRTVVLDIPLPDTATMEAYPDNWFQVRYFALGTKVTDQTTWSLQISGGPVHLTN